MSATPLEVLINEAAAARIRKRVAACGDDMPRRGQFASLEDPRLCLADERAYVAGV